MNQPMNQTTMQEKDFANAILADLKRVSKEYVTAATESNCQQIRDLFTTMLTDVLKSQGELYNLMKQHQMYDQPLVAPRQHIDQQLTQQQSIQQQVQSIMSLVHA